MVNCRRCGAMRITAIVVALVALASGAHAGLNPGVRAYVSFTDSPEANYVPFTGPGIYEACLYVDCLGNTMPPPDQSLRGLRGVMFKWVTSGFGTALAPTYYIAGTQSIGGPDQNHWVIAWPNCAVMNACGFVKVLRQPYYATAPGTIQILANAVDGKLVVDCLYGQDQFCVRANAGIGMTPPAPDLGCTYSECGGAQITCEPQGGSNPAHPPTYWYSVDLANCCDQLSEFRVQTFDPEPANYTNWVSPTGWTHTFHAAGDTVWILWASPTTWLGGGDFGFDNPNPPEWGHWKKHEHGYQPRACSQAYSCWSDGYGYRVHVPAAPAAATRTSWGAIKALYR
jgi:hypothetical protein